MRMRRCDAPVRSAAHRVSGPGASAAAEGRHLLENRQAAA